MQNDATIALERVQSEALGALMSIQSYREVSPAYFDRLRAAVENAEAFFADEEVIPAALIQELESTAQGLRNEASAFPGRTASCLQMADWLNATQQRLLSGAT